MDSFYILYLVVDQPPQSPQIVTLADKILASDVTCTDEQKQKLGQDVFSLEILLVKTEAVLEELQIALKDATGTTAVFTTTTYSPLGPGEDVDMEIPTTQNNTASGLSFDLLENIFFKYYEYFLQSFNHESY